MCLQKRRKETGVAPEVDHVQCKLLRVHACSVTEADLSMKTRGNVVRNTMLRNQWSPEWYGKKVLIVKRLEKKCSILASELIPRRKLTLTHYTVLD